MCFSYIDEHGILYIMTKSRQIDGEKAMAHKQKERITKIVTVRDFLNLPSVKDELRIVAGRGGLSNKVTHVNIMDNPDALDWFSPGELLLTSGYFFRDSEELQNTVVRRLKEINCPGLCIKPLRYLGKIPKNIIDLADELNLPVIEIPYGMAFSKISNILLELVQGNYSEINRLSLDIQQSFFKISLQGGGIVQLTSTLSEMIENPVIVVDKYFDVVAYHDLPHNPFPLGNVATSEFVGLLKSSHYLANLPPNVEQITMPLYRKLNFEDASIKTVLIPINIQNTHSGYIVVWNTMRALSELDYLAIQHSTMSFALERIRKNELQRTKNRIRRDFLEDLLSGQLTDPDNIYDLCDFHNVNIFLKFVVITASVEVEHPKSGNLIENKQFEDAKQKELLNHLDKYRVESFYLYPFTSRGKLIILVGFSENENKYNAEDIKVFCCELIDNIDQNIRGLDIKMGIGAICKSVLELSNSYKQSLEALRLGVQQLNAQVCLYEEFLLHNFLEENVPKDKMSIFFHTTLGKLAEYDKLHNGELLTTLEMWLECNLNVVQTAAALFTHRNTVLYRLEKISEILRTDLKNASERLKYHLALKIRQLIEN